MPPQDPNFDPSVIDINLSLLGASSLEAVQGLVAQLEQVNSHLEQLGQPTRNEQLRTARQGYQPGRVQEGNRPSTGATVGADVQPGYTGHHGVGGSTSTPPPLPPPGYQQQAYGFSPQYGGPPAPPPYQQTAYAFGGAPGRPQSWRLRDVVHSGQAGKDAADDPLHRRLINAWKESRKEADPDHRMFGTYGRVGTFADLWNEHYTRDQGGDGEPSGGASVPPNSGGGGFGGSGGYTGSGGPGFGGGPGGFGGYGGGRGPRDPGDPLHHVSPIGMEGGGLSMPQEFGGVYTPQFYMRLMSRHFARSYLAGADRDQGELGDPGVSSAQAWRARAANLTASAANNYATYHAAYQGVKGTLSRLTGEGGPLGYSIRPGDVEATGEALGYQRGEANVGVGGLGFRVPGSQYFSAAGQEGLRSRRLQTELSMEPNINKQQAAEIVGSTEAFGWSGQDRDTIAYAGLKPLVTQGQKAEDVMPLFDQALRRGNSSIQEVRNTLDHLGDTARRARIPMSELTQSIAESAQTWQEHGATFAQGAQASRDWTDITGLPPQTGAQQLQNPITQGFAMTHYGILPSQTAALGARGVHGLTLESMRMMMNLTTGFNRPLNIPVHDARGRVIGQDRVAGNEMQMRQAAAMAGMSYEDFKRMWTHQRRDQAAGDAQGALKLFGERQRGGNLDHLGHGGTNDMARNAILEARDKAGGPGVHWNQIAGLLKQAGVDQGTVNDIAKKPMVERQAAAQRALDERKNDLKVKGKHGNTVFVKFTGSAEKIFQQVTGGNDHKEAANAGLDSTNSIFSGPMSAGMSLVKSLF